MPVQRTVLGYPVTLHALPRRFIALIALALTIIFVIFVATPSQVHKLPSRIPTYDELQVTAHHAAELLPEFPQVWNPFAKNVHRPPEQANSTHGETRWYSNWDWLNPFSSQITLDDTRVVLPTLPPRTPIYTFYEPESSRDGRIRKAENELLLSWRRAWWAQGFKPVVLSKDEAMRHPMYHRFHQAGQNYDANVIKELDRWLAWSHMGGGILANWLVLPMAPEDDELLSFLRRGEFPRLTRYAMLGNGVYVGDKRAIEEAFRYVLYPEPDVPAQFVHDLIPLNVFDVESDSNHHSLAFYSSQNIQEYFPIIADDLARDRVTGYRRLHNLINAHLHQTWQSNFPDGIAVMKPYPKRTTALTSYALSIAQTLSQCPSSNPIPKSCPPNVQQCRPCDPTEPLHISFPESFLNKSTQYTVATMPHPLTFVTSLYQRDSLDVAFVRRSTLRDQWIGAATRDILGERLSGPQRLVKFKEAVGSEFGTSHALWLTTERMEPIEWEWILGFELPHFSPEAQESKGAGVSVVAGAAAKKLADAAALPAAGRAPARAWPPGRAVAGANAAAVAGANAAGPGVAPLLSTSQQLSKSAAVDIAREHRLLDSAVKTVLAPNKDKNARATRAMLEAWNLADVEAWRFVRAFNMRRKVERSAWEQAEEKFAGGERSGDARWRD